MRHTCNTQTKSISHLGIALSAPCTFTRRINALPECTLSTQYFYLHYNRVRGGQYRAKMPTSTLKTLTCVGLSAGNERQHKREIVELHNLVTRVVWDDALILSQSQLAGLHTGEYGIWMNNKHAPLSQAKRIDHLFTGNREYSKEGRLHGSTWNSTSASWR